MPLFIVSLLRYLLSGVAVKFVAFTAIFGIVAVLIPVVISFISPFIGVSGLNDAFAAIPPGVWWVVDFFRLDFGLPLIISALVARFVIRRLPVVG